MHCALFIAMYYIGLQASSSHSSSLLLHKHIALSLHYCSTVHCLLQCSALGFSLPVASSLQCIALHSMQCIASAASAMHLLLLQCIVSAGSAMHLLLFATRSLGALRAPTSSWRPFGPLDFVLRALRALRSCDPRVGDWIVLTLAQSRPEGPQARSRGPEGP